MQHQRNAFKLLMALLITLTPSSSPPFTRDGTVLKAASYFDDSAPIPPICALAAGTVGFLAPFRVSNPRGMIDRVIMADQQPASCTLRTRSFSVTSGILVLSSPSISIMRSI